MASCGGRREIDASETVIPERSAKDRRSQRNSRPISKMTFLVQAVGAVPRSRGLDRFRTSLVAHCAAEAFALDGNFRASFLAAPVNDPGHQELPPHYIIAVARSSFALWADKKN